MTFLSSTDLAIARAIRAGTLTVVECESKRLGNRFVAISDEHGLIETASTAEEAARRLLPIRLTVAKADAERASSEKRWKDASEAFDRAISAAPAVEVPALAKKRDRAADLAKGQPTECARCVEARRFLIELGRTPEAVRHSEGTCSSVSEERKADGAPVEVVEIRADGSGSWRAGTREDIDGWWIGQRVRFSNALTNDKLLLGEIVEGPIHAGRYGERRVYRIRVTESGESERTLLADERAMVAAR